MSSTIKTQVSDDSAEDYIRSVGDQSRRGDAMVLLNLFESVTGEKPRRWGDSIIGFGQYHYKSTRSRQEGDWPLTGFSPRKQNLTIYVMPGFEAYGDLLARLGAYKTGKSCLYVRSLADIDLGVLGQLVRQSYEDMKKQYDVQA